MVTVRVYMERKLDERKAGRRPVPGMSERMNSRTAGSRISGRGRGREVNKRWKLI
jgi:hypothetical protein